mmetsp:Transcript_31300/g.56802  ORF Transcript_31300/g.56802 Transcript_31300/m.56802 type:complete len:149 (+) Transcript_31300:1279-1725(+)
MTVPEEEMVAVAGQGSMGEFGGKGGGDEGVVEGEERVVDPTLSGEAMGVEVGVGACTPASERSRTAPVAAHRVEREELSEATEGVLRQNGALGALAAIGMTLDLNKEELGAVNNRRMGVDGSSWEEEGEDREEELMVRPSVLRQALED